MAVGKAFVYMMLDGKKVARPHFGDADLRDAYGTYYEKNLERKATPMKRVTVYSK